MTLIAGICLADPSVGGLKQKRESLEEQAEHFRRKKHETLKKVRLMDTNIVRNQIRLEDSQRSLVNQQQRLNETRDRLVYLSASLDRSVGELSRLQGQTGERLKTIYMGERLTFLEMLIESKDLSRLLDTLYYQQKLIAQDKQMLAEMKEKTRQLHMQQTSLAVQKEALAQTIQQISTVKNLIANQIESDRQLRNKYQSDAKYYQQAERQLLAESARIRQQILAMTSRTSAKVVRGGTGIFAWPVLGTLTSRFGHRRHPIHGVRLMHTGLDIAARTGTPVKAADGGEVFYVGWRGGYGKVVMINHGQRNGVNLVTLYGHLSGWAVGQGQSVGKGQVVGYVGSTGYSTGPHLHFEIRERGAPIDPMRYLR
jgi:murein DD-endopeptidase MepM/ murein hydrolase activator NlpD